MRLKVVILDGVRSFHRLPVIINQDDEYESGGAMQARARRFVEPLPAPLSDL